MRAKIILTIFVILLSVVPLKAEMTANGLFNKEYYIDISPAYPPAPGDKIKLRLRTYQAAEKVTLYSDRELEIPMAYRDGSWWGEFAIPADYKLGSHFFTVWVRYPYNYRPQEDLVAKLLGVVGLSKKAPNALWSRSVAWYKMAKPAPPATGEAEFVPPFNVDQEEPLPAVSGEAVALPVASLEAVPFIIKGTKTLAFSSKSIEGTKEGFVPGATREEGLRLNITGKNDDTEINATLISTSTLGGAQVAQREDKTSLLVRKASTEAYFGDFTADLTDTEFTRLDKVLSGCRLKGDYGRWGFNALYSSPKGEAQYKKSYGDGTQGPFRLDRAPVVIDSERVILDGLLQKRGDDYTVDYNAGTVTFTKKTIDPKSILEFYYDYRQTVYQHATYGLRLTAKPLPNMKLGATYLDDSDSLSGAADIRASMSSEAVNPAGHYVVGVDGAFVSELLTANGEAAYSRQDPNLLGSGSAESGRAARLEISSQIGPFGLTAKGKRVGAKFTPISVSNPKQDVTESGFGLSFRPGSLFGAQGSYAAEKYTQSGVVYDNSYKSAKVGLTPERLPSLEYNFSEDNASNDPVTGSTIERKITRDSAETLCRLGFLSASLKGTAEKWLNRSPSEEVTDYRRVNAGLATVGLEKMTFTSNVELENRNMPDGTAPHRRTYNLNLSASPAKPFFLATSIEYLDDSAQGTKNVTDLSYRIEPNDAFKTDGKYTITSVKEDYATAEAVNKYAGSFSLNLRPVRQLRLRYLYKPSYTVICRTGGASYNNEQQQAEVNLLPTADLALGLLYKLGRAFDIYKLDSPDYTIKQNTSDTDSALYTVKMAPLRFMSTEFNYQLDNGRTTSLASAEPLAYTPGRSYGQKFDAVVRTSLTEKFSFDSRYTYQRNTQGSLEAACDQVNSVCHTASLKGNWNVNDLWTFYLSGAYARTTDNLSASPLSYTLSPGAGFIYRRGDRLRVDFDASYSKSFAGSTTELTDLSLRGKYSLSDFVNVTLRAERAISRSPDYKLTDISGNLEINL